MASSSSDNAASQIVDHLQEDLLTVPGQRFALVSFVSPHGKQKSDQCGMKIRGVFNSKEEANAHVKRLQKEDNTFDIFLVEMYKWVLIPPDVSKIDDVQYQETFLNDLITKYKENQELAKQHFLERKERVMKSGLETADNPSSSSSSQRIEIPDDPHPSVSNIPRD